MLKNKAFIVIALVAALLLGVLFVIIILRNLFLPQTQPTEQDTASPTRSPQNVEQEEDLNYNQENTDELLRIVTERPTPPPTDQEIRTELIDSLGGSTGVLHETEQIKIEYVETPDDFEVEIKTTSIEPAKQAAINWFRSQGLSEEGICSLPVFYYLNYEILQELEGTNYTFSPLPEICL